MPPETLEGKLNRLKERREAEKKDEAARRTTAQAAKAAVAGDASPGESNASVDTDLIQHTQAVLGEYLTETLYPSYSRGSVRTFLETVAPYVMTIEPVVSEGDIACSIALKVDPATARLILSSLGASDLADELISSAKAAPKASARKKTSGRRTSAASSRAARGKNTVSLIDLAEGVIPGAGAWGSLADILRDAYEGSDDGVQPHPYLLAMGMKPEHSPLACAAMDYGIRSGELSGWEDAEDSLTGILACVPTREHVTNAASLYGIADVKPCIRNLNQVVKRYSATWGQDTEDDYY